MLLRVGQTARSPRNLLSDDDDTDDRVSPEALREATFTGMRWVVCARAVGEVLAFASAVALARLISPAEFGRVAVALALVPLAVILTFEGCASVLVQRPAITRGQRDSAVLMSLVAGVVLCGVTLLLAPLIAAPLFGPRTASLIQLVAPVFVLASIGAVPRAVLWRRLDFRRVSLIEVMGLLVGSAVSVVLALGGLNGEAIAVGALAATAITSILLYASAPFGLARWDVASLRDIGAFGVPAALAGMVHVAFTNVDYAILAARVSAGQAGIYWRAFQLGVVYQEKVSGIMLRLAFPVYSRTESLVELRRLHQRATRLHATAVVPLLAVLIVTAPVLVPWLFGPAWTGAVVPCQILAGAGMASAVLTGYPQVMLAAGRPAALLRYNVAILALYAAAVAGAVSLGLTAVCLAVVGVYLVNLVAVYRLLLHRFVGVPTRRLVSDVAPAATGSVVLLGAGVLLAELLDGARLPDPVWLCVMSLVPLASYLLTVRALFRPAWADLALITRRLLPRLGRAPLAVAPSSAP